MATTLAQSYLADPMPHVRRAGRWAIHEHCEPSGEHTPPQVTSVINSYMYREYIAWSRTVLLVAQAASARWCRARPVSETVFSVSRRDVCSSYCLHRVTTARFPHCDCWKAKPVEIGQGTACKRDDRKFFENTSNFAAYFAASTCVRGNWRATSSETVLVSCGKLSWGAFTSSRIFLPSTGVPNWFHWILHAHRSRRWLPVYGVGYAMILHFFPFIASLFILKSLFVKWSESTFNTMTEI